MKKLIVPLGVGLLLLTGAGCYVSDDAPLSDSSEDSTTASEQPTTNVQQRPSSARVAPVEVEDDTTGMLTAEQDVGEIGESGGETKVFFDGYPTSPELYKVQVLFAAYAKRMANSTIAAAPKAIPVYEKSDYLNYDPEGKKMVEVGELASAAVLEAQNAFKENKSSLASLTAIAKTRVEAWLSPMIAFEKKWGVGPQ